MRRAYPGYDVVPTVTAGAAIDAARCVVHREAQVTGASASSGCTARVRPRPRAPTGRPPARSPRPARSRQATSAHSTCRRTPSPRRRRSRNAARTRGDTGSPPSSAACCADIVRLQRHTPLPSRWPRRARNPSIQPDPTPLLNCSIRRHGMPSGRQPSIVSRSTDGATCAPRVAPYPHQARTWMRRSAPVPPLNDGRAQTRRRHRAVVRAPSSRTRPTAAHSRPSPSWPATAGTRRAGRA